MSDLIITTQRNRAWYIVTVAGQTKFDLPFQFFENSDVEVYYTADGSTPDPTSDKLPANQYVVTGANLNYSEERYITLTFGAPIGAAVVVNRVVPADQLVDFTVGGTISPETMDFVNNKITILIQQILTTIEQRGLLYPVTSLTVAGQTTLPVLGANEYWQADALGNLQSVTIDENPDWSTLRSQLLSQLLTAPGTDLIGYYDTVNSIGTTLTSFLNTLNTEYNLIKNGIPSTGAATLFIGKASYTPTGWIMMDDGTIGDATSGATTRANADTQNLYEMIWNSVINTWAPVSGGRGLTATDDFNNHKPMALTKQLGRALCVSGSGAGLTPRVDGETLGEEKHQLSLAEMASHAHGSAADPTPNPAAGGGGALSCARTGTTTASVGSDSPHNNMQPSAFWNVIIKL